MASSTDSPDQPQPDPNENPNPNQPQGSPKALVPEALQPQHKPDGQEDLIEEEEAHVDDPDLYVPSSPPTDLRFTHNGFRREGGPKRKKAATKRRDQEKKAQKKLEILSEVLKPIPFVPSKTLEFSSHEKLLKQLGLWDFVHLEFDRDLRTDLIAQLIVTYNSQSSCSYVNGWRIVVNRADLARALKLSKKKDKDSIVDIEESKESIGFLEEFVSNWVLLHEYTWMMPIEVMNWTKMIKECHFEKVDWAGLIWFMVEKELMASPNLKNYYYASHMQCLIKFQKEKLLLEKPQNEVNDAKEEEEEHNGHGDFKISYDLVNESHEGSQLEEHNIELTLGGRDNLMEEDDLGKETGGQDNLMNNGVEKEVVVGDEDVMDYGGRIDVGRENFLRRCDLGDVDVVEEEKEDKGEEVEMVEKEEMGEGVKEEEQEEQHEEQDEQQVQHGRGFPISPNDDNLQVPAVSSFLGNGNRREIDHENDICRNSLNVSNKRLRTDGQWDNSSEFDICMDQMQHLMEKARMLYSAKEQAYGDSSMNQQVLLHELQRRDSLIEHLQKAKFEEQQKRQMKDVIGSGGLVLSTREIEKQRLKQEEKERLNRQLIENKIKDFEAGWIGKLDARKDAVSLLSNKLVDVENEVKHLKELSNRKRLCMESFVRVAKFSSSVAADGLASQFFCGSN
ncbi:uncharacterized protein LOC120185698 [Hibiscus syriacus]|uniref:uncharacterized protein LOC120185698 n=1 Tax=Hibiscus syriacus TaxID=106335 RepID=UPI00192041C2|nr:uncharacterized protein LOC120185698 [Hibiscus syriacus]